MCPQIGKPAIVAGPKDHPETGYQSTFSHDDESASAGYYKVKLQKSGVTVELTAGERAGILRFTFPASDEASIMTDLSHVIGPWHVAESRVRIEDNSTITGFHLDQRLGQGAVSCILPRVIRARLMTRKSSVLASR